MLKGSRYIVFALLRVMLEGGERPSVRALAKRSGYSERTIKRALQALRKAGYIHYEQQHPGEIAVYSINAVVLPPQPQEEVK